MTEQPHLLVTQRRLAKKPHCEYPYFLARLGRGRPLFGDHRTVSRRPKALGMTGLASYRPMRLTQVDPLASFDEA
jgi:hypothetical protein